jgi:nucleotide-binding universal stress UspA family protein
MLSAARLNVLYLSSIKEIPSTAMMTILLPTDFSERSLNACAYALGLFGTAGNTFLLVHTYQDPLPGYEMLVEMSSAGYTEAVEDMADFVKRFRALPFAVDAVLVTEVVKGTMTTAVAGVCRSKGVNVLVMGTQGASALALFGSNAAAMAVSSPVPVLIVPKDARYQGLRRILLADDHAPMEPSEMHLLLEMARRTKAHIAVAHVLRSAGQVADPQVIAAHEVVLTDVEHSFIEAAGDDVALALSNLAERVGADLVAVLHRHMGFLGGLFHASVARELAMHGRIPMLVLQYQATSSRRL